MTRAVSRKNLAGATVRGKVRGEERAAVRGKDHGGDAVLGKDHGDAVLGKDHGDAVLGKDHGRKSKASLTLTLTLTLTEHDAQGFTNRKGYKSECGGCMIGA